MTDRLAQASHVFLLVRELKFLLMFAVFVAVIMHVTVFCSVTTQSVVQPRAVESESEGILGGVGVGNNVPTPTPTSI
jgi:hypothetical protein